MHVQKIKPIYHKTPTSFLPHPPPITLLPPPSPLSLPHPPLSLSPSSLHHPLRPHSEIYPFMVVVFGLENILIIVKAVMSTPEEFDVKYRIATGLYNQGGNITRSVITLALMLAVGIAIFNYLIKVCTTVYCGILCSLLFNDMLNVYSKYCMYMQLTTV